jgi:NTE family protein
MTLRSRIRLPFLPPVPGNGHEPVSRDPAPARRRSAFVLSGGASLGALQVGMLRALYERGIIPDFFVGASAGGLNAAFVACRPQTVDTIDELATVWRAVRREDVFPIGWRVIARGLVGNTDHLASDHGLRELVRRHLHIQRIEDAIVPLHLVTFDLVSGEEVLISRGPALEAVLASAAIPGLLPSVPWGIRRLVDGGVVNNTPISHAVALGAERVYVLPTSSRSRALDKPPHGALEAAVHGITLMIDSQNRAGIAGYADKVQLVVMPAPNPHHVQPIDFRHTQSLIECALSAGREFLGNAALPAA